MEFCITVESPPTQSVRASGRWCIEAEDSEQAVVMLLDSYLSAYWGKGSVWKISERCEDCPYRSKPGESVADHTVCPYHSQRKLLASGTFEA